MSSGQLEQFVDTWLYNTKTVVNYFIQTEVRDITSAGIVALSVTVAEYGAPMNTGFLQSTGSTERATE